MPSETELLRDVALEMQQAESVEELMQLLVDRAAQLLGVPRCTAWLLDPTRSKLLVSARAGMPLHRASYEYRLGQGLLGWIAEHVKPIRTGNADADLRFLPRPGMVEKMGSFLGVPLVSNGTCVGVLAAVNPEQDYFSKRHEDLMVVLAGLLAPQLEAARLQRLALLDEATGAFNRRGLSVAYGRAEERLALGEPVAMIAAGVDHLASAGERAGWSVAEELLRRIVQAILAVLRPADVLVRYDQGRLLAVLLGTELRAAAELADRLRRAASSVSIGEGEQAVSSTLSLGVVEHRRGSTFDETVERAVQALALAERGGRDRVVAG
ncbi:MAG: GAF domain-containing protein [Myxococcales bacterium]|nr:GAF domain-containing protein [Myxococcales bacterium]